MVVISVEDQNDNSPQFPQDSYQFRVREDLAMSGYVITDQFNVRDADIYVSAMKSNLQSDLHHPINTLATCLALTSNYNTQRKLVYERRNADPP